VVLRRNVIADAAMRALPIILLPEPTGDDLRFQHPADKLPIKAFVAEAAIGALVHAGLPQAARLDEAAPDARLRQPFLQRRGHKLTPVVAPQVPRGPVHPDRRLQRPEHLRGSQLPAGDDIDAEVAASSTIVRNLIVEPALVTSKARSRYQTEVVPVGWTADRVK